MNGLSSINSGYYSRFPQYNQNLNFSGGTPAVPTQNSEEMSTAAKLMLGATALAGVAALFIFTRGKKVDTDAVSRAAQQMQDAISTAKKSAKTAIEEGLQFFRKDDFVKPFKEVGEEAQTFMESTTTKVDDTIRKLSTREMYFDGCDVTYSTLQLQKMDTMIDQAGFIQLCDDNGRALQKIFKDKHVEFYNPQTGDIIAKIGTDTREIIENGRIYRLQDKAGRGIVEVLSAENNKTIQKAEKIVASSNVSAICPNNATAHAVDDWNNAQLNHITSYLRNDDNGNLIKRYCLVDGLHFADGTKIEGYTLAGTRVNYKNKLISNPLKLVNKNGGITLYTKEGKGSIVHGSNYAFFELNDKNEIELIRGTWDGISF